MYLYMFTVVTEPCHLVQHVSNLLNLVNILVLLKSQVQRLVSVISVLYTLNLCDSVNYKYLPFGPD
jgi:hypothetical protein